MHIETLRQQLNQLNENIAAATKRPVADLAQQAGEADADTLFLYGIVGGKDVGKTTLINQLAGTTVSLDTDLVDEGTRVTVAYCHKADLAALKQRLGSETADRLHFVTHDRRELKNVVLMDYPDYDSRFTSHLADFAQITPYLQGLVWVTTPRKYGDNAFLEQLAGVAQSHENYFIVVNKMDQLDGKAPLETVRAEVYRFICEHCAKRKIRPPGLDRMFLLSAMAPQTYDFKQMQDRLIRPHTTEEIDQAKVQNLKAEFKQNIGRIDDTYELSRNLNRIEQALSFINRHVEEKFDNDYVETVSRRVAAQQDLQRSVIKTVFAQRIKAWPILRTLFFPLTGVIIAMGHRFGSGASAAQHHRTPQDVLRRNGKTAAFHLIQIRDELLNRFPDLSRTLGREPDFATLVGTCWQRLLLAYEEQLTDHFRDQATGPGFFKRLLIYMPLVWFPFFQPLLIKITAMDWTAGLWTVNLKALAVLLITLLGSGALLTSAAFLTFFYTLLLMAIYARIARAVQRLGRMQIADLWYKQFLSDLAGMLAQPLVDRQVVLSTYKNEMEQIQNQLTTVIHRLAGKSSNPDET
jgi:GTP-binding protein EngB required for normal cell division